MNVQELIDTARTLIAGDKDLPEIRNWKWGNPK